MSNVKHTTGPWIVREEKQTNKIKFVIESEATTIGCAWGSTNSMVYDIPGVQTGEANARLIAAAPTQHKEMLRFLPILERAESDPELWARITEGLGIATLNGYRAAIAKATRRES